MAPSSFYQRLVREIEHIGWKHIAHIDNDLTSIRLVVLYKHCRNYVIRQARHDHNMLQRHCFQRAFLKS